MSVGGSGEVAEGASRFVGVVGLDQEASQVARVVAGDREAFRCLVKRHSPAIEAYARRMLQDAAQAQDVTQEVMLKLWLHADQYRPAQGRLTTWLHRMAHNLCVDHHRQKRRFLMDVSIPTQALDPAWIEDQAPSDPMLSHALMSLPERQAHALVLTYYQGLSNKEVAQVMAIRTRAVESLLVRARRRLKTLLEIQP